MTEQNTYYATLTSYGLDFIQKNLSGMGKFIAEGWYIALGTGELTPALDTKDLTNRIYDKNSEGYPGIRIEDSPEIGRAAYLQAPSSLEGNIITEIGLYDASDKLIMSAKTYIDMTKGFEYGLNKIFDIGISLIALPADVDIVVVNPPSTYPTYSETNIIIKDNINKHNSDPAAHDYLARKDELLKLKTDVEYLIERVYDWRIGKLFIEFVTDIDLSVSFIADGKLKQIEKMPKLFAKWGTKFGGDGVTTFGTPKVQGQFLRALDILNSQRQPGSLESDAMQRIAGLFGVDDRMLGLCTGPFYNAGGSFNTASQGGGDSPAMGFDSARVVRTADETRPKNIGFVPIFYFA